MQASPRRRCRRRQGGFTLVEVAIATVVLLVGLVAVAQLVPMSILLNGANRNDSTALVIAQREMDQLLVQPLLNTTFTDAQGITCPAATVCNLGDPALPNTLVGSPVIAAGATVLVNFAAPLQPGYNFQFVDVNDPTRTSYDIRWAVITVTNAAGPTSKRFIVGVRRLGGNAFYPPVTLDSMVEK
jgi:prepilin-type N-terminal cleavage/methylation domain-containing protein